MQKLPEFQQQQRIFTAYIRDPEKNPAPQNIEPRRMAAYHELFYNNVQGLLAHTYPVLHKILSEEQWHHLIRDYFAVHQAHTPLFPYMPQEFLRYLENERGEYPNDPPFLYELAHYEWIELAVSIDNREINLQGVNKTGDLLTGQPVLNPLVLPLMYQFPVHQIRPEFQPQTFSEQPTYLLVYRDLSDKVSFIHLNAVSAWLVQKLKESNYTGKTALEEIAQELNHPQPEVVITGGLAILQAWLKRDVVLGVKI